MSPQTQKLVASTVTAVGVYVLFFGFPFQGTISNYVHNRQVLKQQKLRYKHEETMAMIAMQEEK